MKIPYLLLCAVLLTGCATGPMAVSSYESARVPVGSTLVLEQPVQVPAWEKQVYFQDGQAMARRRVNVYRAHCALAVAHKPEKDQTIEPDRFEVTDFSTEHYFKEVRNRAPEPHIQLAGFGGVLSAGMDRGPDGAMDYEVMAMVMALESPRQPEVVSLICADWGLPQDAMHINLDKVRQALGALGRLEMPPQP